jgi:hypothetical protein
MGHSLRRLGARLGWRNPRPLPHFLVLGTQKGGTTSLHHLLGRHPGIYLPEVKEVHYFSQHDQQPLGWYADHYSGAKAGQLRGDITPFYLFHCAAPARIHRTLPKARLVALLRDPVERTLSQYFHACRNGYEQLPLEAALEAEVERLQGAEAVVRQPGGLHTSYQKHSYVSRSRYEQQLQRYRALFPARQLLVLRSEDLFTHTEACWDQLLAFLGAAPLALPGPLPRSNAGLGEAQQVSRALREQLRAELAPTYQWLEQEYGISWPER